MVHAKTFRINWPALPNIEMAVFGLGGLAIRSLGLLVGLEADPDRCPSAIREQHRSALFRMAS